MYVLSPWHGRGVAERRINWAIEAAREERAPPEVPLAFGENRLPSGAYGVGFISNNKFVVMDIGGHNLRGRLIVRRHTLPAERSKSSPRARTRKVT
jgi:GNAT superfamily N-acetyltransferase